LNSVSCCIGIHLSDSNSFEIQLDDGIDNPLLDNDWCGLLFGNIFISNRQRKMNSKKEIKEYKCAFFICCFSTYSAALSSNIQFTVVLYKKVDTLMTKSRIALVKLVATKMPLSVNLGNDDQPESTDLTLLSV
jgi:hypothetical protein